MSNATATLVRTVETPKVIAPTWATLKRDMRAAESTGRKAQRKAYDTIVRAYGITDLTSTDTKGTVVQRSDRERGREVLDALSIVAGNVFSLTDVRIGQVVKVYAAIGAAGLDPFSDRGNALYAQFETIRRTDLETLPKASTAVKAAKPGEEAKALAEQVDAAKAAAKVKREAKGKAETASKAVKVENLAAVQAFAETVLPMVRKVSATATPAEKAAARKALEALIAHLQ